VSHSKFSTDANCVPPVLGVPPYDVRCPIMTMACIQLPRGVPRHSSFFLNAFCSDSAAAFGCPGLGLRDEKHSVQQIIHAGGCAYFTPNFSPTCIISSRAVHNDDSNPHLSGPATRYVRSCLSCSGVSLHDAPALSRRVCRQGRPLQPVPASRVW